MVHGATTYLAPRLPAGPNASVRKTDSSGAIWANALTLLPYLFLVFKRLIDWTPCFIQCAQIAFIFRTG